jgi:chromosome segregation protein
MYLKQVEIVGFKSFANKTVLEFLPAQHFQHGAKNQCGITAIVGPNGSGKSNVSDAIKWAMGEQSMKTLRGKKSEDVIFAGSGSKARLSSASVKLIFDNSDKRIPLEYGEVTITRKLYRSGDSEYLINGSKVRLLDIQDMLAKAGVGRESYCVINQGMSDAVLNATPVERRSVIEDAAGVKQFQIKKDRSLKKLDSTLENIERTSALVREIEPHLKMLKRQAEKAQQGKEISIRLKEKQILLFSYLWYSFQTEQEKFSQEKNIIGARMMNMQRELDKLSDELTKETPNMETDDKKQELEKKRSALQHELNEAGRELIITEGRVVVEKEKLAQQKVVEIIPVDLRYVQRRLEKIRSDQESLIKRVEEAENMEQLQGIKEFARAIQQELHDLYEQAGKGKVEVKKDTSKEQKEIQDHIDILESKKADCSRRENEIRMQITNTENLIREEIERARKMRERFFELERQVRGKQEELNRLKDQFNEAKIKLARIEVREEDLTAEIREQLKCEPKELDYDGTPVERETLEREISRLRVQMEQIGGIDPMILQEYQETNARFEFLTQESLDLQNAIGSLSKIIKEMEQKIGEQFEKAFDQINKEFSEYFKIIFGGGKAELIKVKSEKRKVKSENVLEGEETREESESDDAENKNSEMGVEIYACPPGKKIANLSMLSGGERSLTSLALLFAIIAHNPPPFAILDEVEAALDEANSRRFGKILQELSAHTQFIAITHNRETMRQAALLYGVTMGDDGISKLLSVKLDQVGAGGRIFGK